MQAAKCKKRFKNLFQIKKYRVVLFGVMRRGKEPPDLPEEEKQR